MITVVGSLNMDLVIESPRLPAPGETILGRHFRRAPGGKGANQAYTVARMGMAGAMIGAVGDDAFGAEMVSILETAGVDATGVVRRARVASGVAMIVVDGNGQNQIVVAGGANDTLAPADITRQAALFRRSKAVVAQLETPLPTVAAALQLGRDHGALAVLNPAPLAPGSLALLRLCDWLIANENEISKLSGVEVRDVASARKAARAIKDSAACPNILITLGANGVWIDASSFTGHVPGFTVEAVDTVGAGDAFIGAFVTRLVEGAEAQEAAQFGCAAAALAVTKRGAQASIPARAEVEKVLERGKIGG